MRDVLIHNYMGVDLEAVWRVTQGDLPKLRQAIEELLGSQEPDTANWSFIMDTSYHYPPELLDLMVDTIPRLTRSKPGVLDFLRGAGVKESHLADLR